MYKMHIKGPLTAQRLKFSCEEVVHECSTSRENFLKWCHNNGVRRV